MNRKLAILLLPLLLCFTAVGVAAPSSQVAWTADLKNLVDAGDAAKGEQLEAVEPEDVNACLDCHGKGGTEPDRAKYPMLSGQVAPYTFKQLKDYQSGDRKHKKMREATEKLSDQQLADLSAWFAGRALPVPELDAEAEVSEATRQLVFKGDKTRLIQPCAACHGEKGEGAIIDVPAIAGQNPKYFVDTMKKYAKGRRGNDIYGRMRIIAAALSRAEIDELANYYAGLTRP